MSRGGGGMLPAQAPLSFAGVKQASPQFEVTAMHSSVTSFRAPPDPRLRKFRAG